MGEVDGKGLRLRSESGEMGVEWWDGGGKNASWETGIRWMTTWERADVDASASTFEGSTGKDVEEDEPLGRCAKL